MASDITAFNLYRRNKKKQEEAMQDESSVSAEELKRKHTADELKEMLAEKEIEFPSKATKDDLVDLLIGAEKHD